MAKASSLALEWKARSVGSVKTSLNFSANYIPQAKTFHELYDRDVEFLLSTHMLQPKRTRLGCVFRAILIISTSTSILKMQTRYATPSS
jgi:hypothetical protein